VAEEVKAMSEEALRKRLQEINAEIARSLSQLTPSDYLSLSLPRIR
jgi:hypothetical protein